MYILYLPEDTHMASMQMQMQHTSNERLCDMFEMLVNRLGVVEEQSSNIKDFAQKRARHEDSLKPLGAMLSGLALCGRCVDLVVYNRFNFDGNFRYSKPDDMIIMVSEGVPMFFRENIWKGGGTSKWDEDLRAVWGATELLAMKVLYAEGSRKFSEANTGRDNAVWLPSSKQLGLTSHQDCGKTAIIEIALKHRHPGLIAIGNGFAVENTDIGRAVALFDDIMQDLGVTLPLWVGLYQIPAETRRFATAVLGQYDTMAAWSALSNQTRSRLRRDQHSKTTYFCEQVLEECNNLDFVQDEIIEEVD